MHTHTHHILMPIYKHAQSRLIRLSHKHTEVDQILIVVNAHFPWLESLPADDEPHDADAPAAQASPPLPRLLLADKRLARVRNIAHVVELGSSRQRVGNGVLRVAGNVEPAQEQRAPVRVAEGIEG